jgi:lipopolysaccharide heptosyltransferase I
MIRPMIGCQSPRILIVKLSAIGDVVHAMPVACALRERFPGAFIAWLAEGRCGDLLRGHSAVDELIVVRRRWLKSPRQAWQLRGTLRRLRFDVSIDLQGLTKSAVAAWLSDARRRIGFAGEMGRELSAWLNNDRHVARLPHVVDRYLELLRPLGIDAPQVRFDLPHWPDAAATVEGFLAHSAVADRFAVINPGAGWPSKRWPPERFAAVARHLAATHGLRSVVVWAGALERQWAGEIAAASAGSAMPAPATSLVELAELARRATLLVASDTGPLHIAAAVGTPCVGLFGPMPAERNGPYGPGHIALQNAILTGPSRQRRRADNATMLAIGAAQVCRACDEMLHRRDGGNRREEDRSHAA